MQIYFFIGANLKRHIAVIGYMEQGSFLDGMAINFSAQVFDERWLEWRLVLEPMRFSDSWTSESAVTGVDASNESGLFFARTIEAEVRE
jgi:hypothetical protein